MPARAPAVRRWVLSARWRRSHVSRDKSPGKARLVQSAQPPFVKGRSRAAPNAPDSRVCRAANLRRCHLGAQRSGGALSFGFTSGRMVSARGYVRVSSAQAHQYGCRASAVDAFNRARPIIPDLHEETALARPSAIPCAVPAWEAHGNIAESELLRGEGDDHAFIRINAHGRRVFRLNRLEDEPRLLAQRSAGAGGGA